VLVWRKLAAIVAADGAGALVSVHRVGGSAPREEGAALAMRPDGAFHGTIGGGRLEWEALREARAALAAGRGAARWSDHALGPDLGQCCGGRVTLRVETFDGRDGDELAWLAEAEGEGCEVEALLDETGRVTRHLPLLSPLRGGGRRPPPPTPPRKGEGSTLRWIERLGEVPTTLLLFGAGHVGRALVLSLAPLPFAVRWIDGRDDAFPTHIPANVRPICAPEPPSEIDAAPPGTFVLVMTHDHALDLALTAAALRRADLPFVGLIGSATKRARFERRLRTLGLPAARIAALACPIGLPGIAGKEPAVIAASAAAQLLLERSRLRQLSPADLPERATA
jgi:xanthine dehydrogenase accessory factor